LSAFAVQCSPAGISAGEGGTGVKPDVAVPANQALLTAHLMALKKALKKHHDDRTLAESLQRTVAEKEKELEAMKAKKVSPTVP
jgi:hypothetical protein